jgi:AcrR family transcriptional regulator
MSGGGRAPTGPGSVSGPFGAVDSRTRLLAATVHLLAEQGWAPADPAGIARSAAVPTPIFYRYFADTEAAALAAYDRTLAWLEAELLGAPEPPDSSGALLVQAFVARILTLLAPHPPLTRFCAWDFPRSSPVAFERHRAAVEKLAAALRCAREDCAPSSDLPRRWEEFAVAGAISVLGRRTGPVDADLRRSEPEISYFLLVPYLGTDRARRLAFGEGRPSAAPAR